MKVYALWSYVDDSYNGQLIGLFGSLKLAESQIAKMIHWYFQTPGIETRRAQYDIEEMSIRWATF
jgi:hypothetical protein